jgi:uncharacterized repeat protein (TIGR03803 family)
MSKIKWTSRACAIFLLWAAAAVALPAQTLNTLYNFCSQGGTDCTDGANPGVGMVQGTDGNFYGTTFAGGSFESFGTLFKITPSGTLKTLHIFYGAAASYPIGGLVQGTDGNFYGTTELGGSNLKCSDETCGTVFKMTPSGTLTMLHSFDGTDGKRPRAALIQAADGNFYGTASSGGPFLCSCGTVFKITPSGTLTTLHSFANTDGAYPYAGLVQGSDGNLYGTTYGGGLIGEGTVFKITTSGMLTMLHSFNGTVEGTGSVTALVQGTDGNFYGTASTGGAHSDGTVFKITPGGTLKTLHDFDGTDGSLPNAGLVQGTDGNFYGTTPSGGSKAAGTVFKITPSGTLTTLYIFCSQSNCTDGSHPSAALTQGTNGNFYGATSQGGANLLGTVFSLSVGLGQFVRTQPTFGTVGEAVNILGTNLTGATSVTFNGTAATFTVVSRSLITTTVPAGATAGKVQVTNSGGTLSSNVPFRVN